jgi:hypothetical protein
MTNPKQIRTNSIPLHFRCFLPVPLLVASLLSFPFPSLFLLSRPFPFRFHPFSILCPVLSHPLPPPPFPPVPSLFHFCSLPVPPVSPVSPLFPPCPFRFPFLSLPFPFPFPSFSCPVSFPVAFLSVPFPVPFPSLFLRVPVPFPLRVPSLFLPVAREKLKESLRNTGGTLEEKLGKSWGGGSGWGIRSQPTGIPQYGMFFVPTHVSLCRHMFSCADTCFPPGKPPSCWREKNVQTNVSLSAFEMQRFYFAA